jgi:hypothetical protein
MFFSAGDWPVPELPDDLKTGSGIPGPLSVGKAPTRVLVTNA